MISNTKKSVAQHMNNRFNDIYNRKMSIDVICQITGKENGNHKDLSSYLLECLLSGKEINIPTKKVSMYPVNQDKLTTTGRTIFDDGCFIGALPNDVIIDLYKAIDSLLYSENERTQKLGSFATSPSFRGFASEDEDPIKDKVLDKIIHRDEFEASIRHENDDPNGAIEFQGNDFGILGEVIATIKEDDLTNFGKGKSSAENRYITDPETRIRLMKFQWEILKCPETKKLLGFNISKNPRNDECNVCSICTQCRNELHRKDSAINTQNLVTNANIMNGPMDDSDIAKKEARIQLDNPNIFVRVVHKHAVDAYVESVQRGNPSFRVNIKDAAAEKEMYKQNIDDMSSVAPSDVWSFVDSVLDSLPGENIEDCTRACLNVFELVYKKRTGKYPEQKVLKRESKRINKVLGNVHEFMGFHPNPEIRDLSWRIQFGR